MRVIVEFVKNDIGEDQLLLVVRDLLPALLQVLGDDKVSSVWWGGRQAGDRAYTISHTHISLERNAFQLLDK